MSNKKETKIKGKKLSIEEKADIYYRIKVIEIPSNISKDASINVVIES